MKTTQPPRWQQAAATLVALYPAVLLADVVVRPLVIGLPWALAILATIAPVVVTMTYVLMPLAMRAIAPRPRHRASSRPTS